MSYPLGQWIHNNDTAVEESGRQAVLGTPIKLSSRVKKTLFREPMLRKPWNGVEASYFCTGLRRCPAPFVVLDCLPAQPVCVDCGESRPMAGQRKCFFTR